MNPLLSFQNFNLSTTLGTPALSIPRSSPSPQIPDLRTPSPGIGSNPRIATGSFDAGNGLHSPISPSSARSRSPLVPDEPPRNDWGAPVVDDRFSTSPTKSPTRSIPNTPPKPRRSSTIESETELGYRGDSGDEDEPASPTRSNGNSLGVRPGIRRAETAPDAFERTRGGTMDNTAADARLRMLERKETAPLNLRPRGDSSATSSGEPLSTQLTSATSPQSPTRSDSPTTLPDSVAFPRNAHDDDNEGGMVLNRHSVASSASSYTDIPPDEENNRLSTLTTSTTRLSMGGMSTTSRARNRGSSRRISKSTGSKPKGIKLPMETLEEESAPSTSQLSASDLDTLVPSANGSSLTIPTTRQRTKSGPSSVSTSRSSSSTSRRHRTKTCVKCGKTIEDGRWIAVDAGSSYSSASLTSDAKNQQHLTIKSTSSSGSGSSSSGEVLCEKDWKEMYLPKCRRCGLTIESQAVSSADGQLKGKYHRACFNCSTCQVGSNSLLIFLIDTHIHSFRFLQKPFPDKEFYVFGGQPYCDYHYHVANNSLCSSPTCRRPIEGPCAEDHEGRRYHPEHLVCAKDGCETRLVEYFCDSDGKMFCEEHATSGQSALASLIGEDSLSPQSAERPLSVDLLHWNGGSAPSSPNEKRRTRFLEI